MLAIPDIGETFTQHVKRKAVWFNHGGPESQLHVLSGSGGMLGIKAISMSSAQEQTHLLVKVKRNERVFEALQCTQVLQKGLADVPPTHGHFNRDINQTLVLIRFWIHLTDLRGLKIQTKMKIRALSVL